MDFFFPHPKLSTARHERTSGIAREAEIFYFSAETDFRSRKTVIRKLHRARHLFVGGCKSAARPTVFQQIMHHLFSSFAKRSPIRDSNKPYGLVTSQDLPMVWPEVIWYPHAWDKVRWKCVPRCALSAFPQEKTSYLFIFWMDSQLILSSTMPYAMQDAMRNRTISPLLSSFLLHVFFFFWLKSDQYALCIFSIAY